MRRAVLVLVVLVVACSGEPAPGSSSSAAVGSSAVSSIGSDVASSTTIIQQDCGSIPYQVETLPERVEGETPPIDDVPQDEFTTVPGTESRLWFDTEGELAVVLVRGALPPVAWPGDRGEVSIDGARGVAGSLDDGTWMVGWFEGEGDPCDRYFMVFYPPVDTAEVEATIESINRTAG